MNMNKIIGAGALAAAALFAAASCSEPFDGTDFDGTTSSQSANERSFTAVSSDTTTKQVAKSATINATSDSATSTTARVTVTVTSATRLNADTFADAFRFYTLTPNGENYPKRAASQLSKTLVDTLVNVSSSNQYGDSNVTTKITYDVAISGSQYSTIALLTDAARLRDRQGALVLNKDGNATAGEETDSQVDYITLTGAGLTALPAYTYEENFCPEYPYYSSSTTASGSFETSGAYTVTVVGNVNLGTGLAGTLYSLRYREPGSSEWKKLALTFKKGDTDGTYTATTSQKFAAGTKVQVVTTVPARSESYTESVESVAKYGHKAYLSYYGSDLVTYGTADTNGYHGSTNPGYIVTSGAYSATSAYDYDTIRPVQKNILSVSSLSSLSINGVGWEVTCSAAGGFSATGGFIITDGNNVRVASTTTQVDSATVRVVADNQNLTDDNNEYKLWVGSGTSIYSGAYNATSFGSYADVEHGDASGYVQLGD